jgi:cysteine synthase A
MDAEERAISASTPLCRFGDPAPRPAAAPSAPAAPADPAPLDAREFVARAIGDPDQPVAMFALEWCEFSWAVRRFLTDLGVPYRSVDLDSARMQASGLVGGIRKALRDLTGEATIPQIFIGGIPVGGAVDLLSRHDRGELEPLLRRAGIVPTGDAAIVARGYLPKWLASRSA